MAQQETYRSARYEPSPVHERPMARPQAAYMARQAAPVPAYAGDDYDDEPAVAAAAMPMRRAPEAAPQPAARAVPPKPQAKASPPPPPPPQVDEEMPSDEDLDKMFGPSRDEAASRAFGGGSNNDDTTELDEDAIEQLPDPKPVRQIADEDDDLDDLDDMALEDIPDPDPIPTVYGGDVGDEDEDDDLEEGGSALSKLVAPAIAIVTVGVLISGLILGRGFLVSFWPGANDYFYDYIGMHVMVPGDGLERKLTRTAVETVANIDHVIATGTVTNVSEKEQQVPTVLVQLLDAKVQVLEQKEVKIDKGALQPGETVQFRAVFEGAPATARTVRTEWGRFAETAAN
jgi:hypothetical protein